MGTFDGDVSSGQSSGMGLPTGLSAGILAALLLGAVPPAAPAGKLFRYSSTCLKSHTGIIALETGDVGKSVIQNILGELRV